MIPEFKQFILPVLQFLGDGKSHTIKECTNNIQQIFSLSNEEMEQLLPSGSEGIVKNRTNWALTYLKKSGLAYSEKRGIFQITKSGKELLKNPLLPPPHCSPPTPSVPSPPPKPTTHSNITLHSKKSIPNSQMTY